MTDPVDPNASLQYDGLGQDPDRTYLRLKGCREKLCLVQMDVPRHWSDEVGQAINLIDMVGKQGARLTSHLDWHVTKEPSGSLTKTKQVATRKKK